MNEVQQSRKLKLKIFVVEWNPVVILCLSDRNNQNYYRESTNQHTHTHIHTYIHTTKHKVETIHTLVSTKTESGSLSTRNLPNGFIGVNIFFITSFEIITPFVAAMSWANYV